MDDEEQVRRRIHEALGVAEPHPSLRSRVVSSMPVEPGGGRPWRQWAMGAVAAVLAVAIVAGLSYVRLARGRSAHPAAIAAGTLTMSSQLDFKCTLPVQAYQNLATVALPSGQVSIDGTLPQGKGVSSYDHSYREGRWLPVPAQWVSPDGRSYAYVTNTSGVPGQPGTSALYVHDIAAGRDRQLWSGDGSSQMGAWGPVGIYFARQQPNGTVAGTSEFWSVDPANPATAHRVGPVQQPAAGQPPAFFSPTQIAGGGVWTTGASKPLQATQGVVVGGRPDQVRRMDLRDGSVSIWFTAPEGKSVGLLGFDGQGHPVLSLMSVPVAVKAGGPLATPDPALIYPPPPALLLLTGPDRTVELSDGSDPALRPNSVFGDAHGIWMTSPGSLWLYRGGSLTKVADVPASLFPPPTPASPPAGLQSPLPPPPSAPPSPAGLKMPSPPPGYPTGPYLRLLGGCA